MTVRYDRALAFLAAGQKSKARADFEKLMAADPTRLAHRNGFNISAMNFTPERLAAEIRTIVPGFVIEYEVDPARQAIADSWPRSVDDSAARREWGWAPRYDIAAMTKDMLEKIGARYKPAQSPRP